MIDSARDMRTDRHTNSARAVPGQGGSRVIASKLAPPVARSLVPRPQIHERLLNAETSPKLILISAPAGFGKTSLMAQHHALLQARGVRACWLTLDQADNDMERLMLHLGAALGSLDDLDGREAQSGISDPATVPSSDLPYRIATTRQAFAFFIDELEVLLNPAGLDFIRLLTTHLPPHGRFVIGSRTIPSLGLGRLRARGQLVEITAADLKLSFAETAALLRRNRQLTLSDEEVETLLQRTEGWPAAIQLASLSLASHHNPERFIAAFSSSNSDVTDYLAEDVFRHLPHDIRDFLLRTCILRELSPPLCDAVTGRKDSATMLERIERANLFVTQTDKRTREYRYHALFSGFLQQQLAALYPWVTPSLHGAASRWFSEAGRPIPAIEHALLSGDLPRSLELLATHADWMLREGRFSLLARWLKQIPLEELAPYPDLRIAFAWALTATRNLALAKEILDGFVDPSDAIRTWVVALRAYLLTMEDRPSECFALCRRELGPSNAGLTTQYASLNYFFAYWLVAADDFTDALRCLDESKRAYACVESAVGVAIAERVHGTMELVQGHLRDATMRLRRAYENSAQSREVSLSATVGVILARVLYERGELSGAERLLNECLALAKESGIPDILINGSITSARIAEARGDREQALELISDLENLGHHANLPRLVASAWLERARLATIDGELSLAATYLENADDKQLWGSMDGFTPDANDVDSLLTGRLRWRIHAGKADTAVVALKDHLKQALQANRHHRALKLRILLASALQVCGDFRGSMRTLTEALQFGAREGFISIFRDEGPQVLSMLATLRETAADQETELSGFMHRLLAPWETSSPTQAPHQPLPSAQAHAESFEGLTDREHQVLTILASGLSNQELAGKLFVSESTVKTHLARINTKLGVHNRTQAIAVARKLGVIQ
ncbi:LuxR C-terminal-related transcriptional regulator [Pseudothauera rhizosphaerae]|uniref:LuxR family transcriptional regulator n=1 Tax=Pseudothauera rhizosphaerae TaxID=2565932 RepID=A0A4S4ALN4_9RHOO|nr:LuxR C-terminal-related transcriptional regulator [Pseudothauera rhizosphaerae]THF60352.1 LuxR family transcriptional regulator [Pseudothauera rhizosphaerae]